MVIDVHHVMYLWRFNPIYKISSTWELWRQHMRSTNVIWQRLWRHSTAFPTCTDRYDDQLCYIHLVRVGQDAGSDYSALIQAAHQSERVDSDFANLTLHFPPELVKRHPKAAPRNQRKKQTRRRKTTILTDTPEKQVAEKESQVRELKKRKKTHLVAERKLQPEKVTKPKRHIEMEFEPDNTDVLFLVCMEAYSNIKPGEQWIKCMDCRNWSHLSVQEFQQMKSVIFVTTIC